MHTDNPIIAELWRGTGIESMHRGAWVLVDTNGTVIDSRGDPDQLVYARSSSKSMQALPLLESGAAGHLGLTDAEIAVSISSHNGEAIHVDAVRSILTKAGLTPESLRCGTDAPAGSEATAAPARVTHNCSGKHAGFLATATALGDDPVDYLDPQSRVQTLVHRTVVEMTGADPARVSMAVDGCSAPTFRLPLRSLATGLARVANPDDLSSGRADACRRILSAARAHPEHVAGTVVRRFDTDAMVASHGRLFCKGGAEGVQTVGVVAGGLGFAAKIDDGSTRSLHRLTIAVLHAHGHLSDAEMDALSTWHDPVRHNADGLDIGRHIVPDDIIPNP